MGINENVRTIIHLASFVVILEALWRITSPLYFIKSYNLSQNYWATGGIVFVSFYGLCIISPFLLPKDCSFVKHPFIRVALSISHGIDGLMALFIGLSLYYQSVWGLFLSVGCITKFGLLNLLNRMILVNKTNPDNSMETITLTSKSFLHHVGSFLFLMHPAEILITLIWRTMSMTGHAMLVLRGKLPPSALSQINWMLSYLRMLFLTIFMVGLCYSPVLREQFGYSAAGHTSYMTVRFMPLLQLGGIYLNEEEKAHWSTLKEQEKLWLLCQGKHLFLTIELLQLLFLTVFFGSLRVQLLWNQELSMVTTSSSSLALLPTMDMWQQWMMTTTTSYLRGSLSV